MCSLTNFTWKNLCNYWLCCWLLEQWDRHPPSKCGCMSYDKMQSGQHIPTLKRNLLLPFWGSLSVGWMMGRVTQFTTKTVSWKQGKGCGVRIWLQPIQTSHFWLVSFHVTCLHHYSAYSLYSLWPRRWTQHVPLKWWYEPTRLHDVNKNDWKTLELT